MSDRIIFVFGSNTAGRHGKGAALYARQMHDARYGVGEGPTGRAYAIPTKDDHLQPRSLAQIEVSIDRFIDYTRLHADTEFFVTRIGCGLAGYLDSQIAPLFMLAPENVMLPEGW